MIVHDVASLLGSCRRYGRSAVACAGVVAAVLLGPVPAARAQTTTSAPTTTAPTTTAPTTTAPTPARPSTVPVAGPAAFPSELLGVVPDLGLFPNDPPQRVMSTMYAPLTPSAERRDVVVLFARPFTLPTEGWRVSVYIGEPTGQRLRATLLTSAAETGATVAGNAVPGTGGATPTGSAARFDGQSWHDIGPIPVAFDPNGTATITVPVAEAPIGGVVWAEVSEESVDTPVRISPFFNRDAFFGEASPGTVPSAPMAMLLSSFGAPTGVPASLTTAPELTVRDGVARIGYSSPPDTEVAGRSVTQVIDTLRLVPDFTQRASRAYEVRIDWNARRVTLFDAVRQPPVELTGTQDWLIEGFPAGDETPTAIEVYVPTLATALGIGVPAGSVAFSVTRVIFLSDGRAAAEDGVMATSQWLNRTTPAVASVPAPAASPTTSRPPAEETSTEAKTVAIVAIVAVFLVIAALVMRRRRQQQGLPQLVPEPTPSAPPERPSVPSAAALPPPPAGPVPTSAGRLEAMSAPDPMGEPAFLVGTGLSTTDRPPLVTSAPEPLGEPASAPLREPVAEPWGEPPKAPFREPVAEPVGESFGEPAGLPAGAVAAASGQSADRRPRVRAATPEPPAPAPPSVKSPDDAGTHAAARRARRPAGPIAEGRPAGPGGHGDQPAVRAEPRRGRRRGPAAKVSPADALAALDDNLSSLHTQLDHLSDTPHR